MPALHRYTFLAALALGVLPVAVPAGEAPATSAAAQRESEKKLAEAQAKLDAAAKEVAELSRQMGRRFNFVLNNDMAGGPPRALLGVSIEPASGREGARVVELSPGGAAAEAGIKVGDIITGVADLDLTKDGEPARALIEKMNQLQPDQKVKVAVMRDGKKLSFDIAPRPAPPDVLVRRFDLPNTRGPGNPGPQGQGGPRPEIREFIQRGTPAQPPGTNLDTPQRSREFISRTLENLRGLDGIQSPPGSFNADETRFGGAELASLSERLGSYFGVKSGVLVVRAGVDSQFKLQDGDVLMAIDGRDITSAQQAGRILRSYQPGEKLKLKVQRDRKVQELEITAPGARRPN
jgi:S1-C subfamily serine protease